MIKFIKGPIFIGGVIVAMLLGWYFYANRDTGPTYETVKAEMGEVMEEVSVTGRVKPAEEVAMSFEKGGKVSGVYIKVGDKVYSGETLASLDKSELQTQLAQAEANFKVQEIKVENASVNLEEAKRNIVDKIHDAYTKSDDAVRTKAGPLFSNSTSSYTQLSFVLDNAVLKADLEKEKLDIEISMTTWQASLATLTPSADLQNYINLTKNNLETVKSFLKQPTEIKTKNLF